MPHLKQLLSGWKDNLCWQSTTKHHEQTIEYHKRAACCTSSWPPFSYCTLSHKISYALTLPHISDCLLGNSISIKSGVNVESIIEPCLGRKCGLGGRVHIKNRGVQKNIEELSNIFFHFWKELWFSPFHRVKWLITALKRPISMICPINIITGLIISHLFHSLFQRHSVRLSVLAYVCVWEREAEREGCNYTYCDRWMPTVHLWRS